MGPFQNGTISDVFSALDSFCKNSHQNGTFPAFLLIDICLSDGSSPRPFVQPLASPLLSFFASRDSYALFFRVEALTQALTHELAQCATFPYTIGSSLFAGSVAALPARLLQGVHRRVAPARQQLPSPDCRAKVMVPSSQGAGS